MIYLFEGWCSGCQLELKKMVLQAAILKSLDVQLIAICGDKDADWLRSFEKKIGITWPVLMAKDTDVHDRFASSVADGYTMAPNGIIQALSTIHGEDDGRIPCEGERLVSNLRCLITRI